MQAKIISVQYSEPKFYSRQIKLVYSIHLMLEGQMKEDYLINNNSSYK